VRGWCWCGHKIIPRELFKVDAVVYYVGRLIMLAKSSVMLELVLLRTIIVNNFNKIVI